MSLDADAAGQVVLLDQVNQRALLLPPGGPTRIIAAPRTAQEVLLSTGELWFLDRLVAKTAVRVSPQSGAVLDKVSLSRPDIEEPGGITALVGHDGALWAELEHTRLVRLATLGGKPAPTATLAGRPTLDGKLLLRGLRVPPRDVAVAGRALDAAPQTAPTLALQTTFELQVAQVLELAGDASGRIWLAADTVALADDGRPTKVQREVAVWNADGTLRGRTQLCAPDGPEETLRPVRLGANGKLYALCVQASGATLQEVAP